MVRGYLTTRAATMCLMMRPRPRWAYVGEWLRRDTGNGTIRQLPGIPGHNVSEHDVSGFNLSFAWLPKACYAYSTGSNDNQCWAFSQKNACQKAPRSPRRLNKHGTCSMPEHSELTRIT